MIRTFLDICRTVGVPIAIEKTEWGTEMINFLGILLDGRHFRLCIPLEKREKAIQMLQLIMSKRKATVKELQSMCGYLNFLCKAIFPGRLFLRRMYAKYSYASTGAFIAPQQKVGTKLKAHHDVKLDCEFKNDCRVWLDFLTSDGVTDIVSRPMIDLLGPAVTNTETCFYSDASGSKKKGGYGCIMNDRWIYGAWDEHFM